MRTTVTPLSIDKLIVNTRSCNSIMVMDASKMVLMDQEGVIEGKKQGGDIDQPCAHCPAHGAQPPSGASPYHVQFGHERQS